MEKICEFCGESFQTNLKERKYCSRDCSWEANCVEHPKHTCSYCGESFRRSSTKIVTENVYCSRKCLNEVRREILKRRKGTKNKGAIFVTIECKYCKQIFEQKCYEKTRRKQFCTVSCATKYRHEEKERLGAKNLKQAKKMKVKENEQNNNL